MITCDIAYTEISRGGLPGSPVITTTSFFMFSRLKQLPYFTLTSSNFIKSLFSCNSIGFQAVRISLSSNICFFSANGLNSDNNDICIFAKATSSDVTNSEYLRIGWDTTDYIISSNKIGTGIVHNIKMECGIVDQFVLKNDGTISISSTSVSSCSSIGALVLTKGGLSIDCTENASSSSVGGAITVVGGVSIAKDTYIGGVLNLNNVELRSSITQNSYSSIVITSSDNKYPSVFLQGHSSVNSSVYPVEMRLYNLGNDDNDLDGISYEMLRNYYELTSNKKEVVQLADKYHILIPANTSKRTFSGFDA